MTTEKNFMERAVRGDVGFDIDDYVEAWHRGDGGDAPISAFLGMSEDEYRLWVEWPNVLPYIVERRREEARLRAMLPRCFWCARGAVPRPAESVDGGLCDNGDHWHYPDDPVLAAAGQAVTVQCEAAGANALIVENARLQQKLAELGAAMQASNLVLDPVAGRLVAPPKP